MMEGNKSMESISHLVSSQSQEKRLQRNLSHGTLNVDLGKGLQQSSKASRVSPVNMSRENGILSAQGHQSHVLNSSMVKVKSEAASMIDPSEVGRRQGGAESIGKKTEAMRK